MIDFLSSNTWQGIGVITSVILALIGIFLSQNTRHRIFRSKNTKFKNKSNLPKEIFDGQTTTLYGKVREELFPGPPNYESIDNGDVPQFYWILYTNEPISLVGRCMETNELRDNGESCAFQLCLTGQIYNNRLDILGKYVKVDGEIFFGHTGHHKTKALLDVNSIQVLK